MQFDPKFGHTDSGKGRGGYGIETGRTRKRVSGVGMDNATRTVQTRNEYRSPRGRQEALPNAQNYAKRPSNPVAKQLTRGGVGNTPQWPAGYSSVLPRGAHRDLVNQMMKSGVHKPKIRVNVRLKKGQAIA